MRSINFLDMSTNLRIALQIIKETIEIIESGKPNISRGSVAPTGGNDKDLYIDDVANRLYVNVNGTWKYTSLT